MPPAAGDSLRSLLLRDMLFGVDKVSPIRIAVIETAAVAGLVGLHKGRTVVWPQIEIKENGMVPLAWLISLAVPGLRRPVKV